MGALADKLAALAALDALAKEALPTSQAPEGAALVSAFKEELKQASSAGPLVNAGGLANPTG